jgi:hypothetical protein
VTADGTEREVDCIIYGTGFRANDFMLPMEIVGNEGRTLREVWAEGVVPRRWRPDRRQLAGLHA